MYGQDKFLLIALSKNAKDKIDKFSLTVDKINDALEELPVIKLFRSCYKEEDRVALHFNYKTDTHVLLLVKDEHENHFLCTDFWYGKQLSNNDSGNLCHRLYDDVKCRLTETAKISNYRDNAIDHSEAWRETLKKEKWKPSQGNSIEERKWCAYLDLFMRIIDSKTVEFKIGNVNKINNKRLRGSVIGSNEDKDKVSSTDRGEQILLKLKKSGNNGIRGKWLSYHKGNGNLEIEFDNGKRYDDLLKLVTSNQKYDTEDGSECNCEFVDEEKFHKIKAAEKENCFYFDGENIFTAKTKIYQENTNADKNEDGMLERGNLVYCINKNTIRLNNLFCSIDYSGDRSQIKVMERSFRKVIQLPIWDVLSGERVAKLPNGDFPVKFDSDSRLNDEQRKAVEKAINAPELCLIWGPPGTGKTEIIKEIAKQEAQIGNKALICSQGNLAVDNALARLDEIDGVYPFRIHKDSYELEGEDLDKVPTEKTSHRFYLSHLARLISNHQDKLDGNSKDKDILGKFESQIRKKLVSLAKETNNNESAGDNWEREIKQFAKLYKRRINVVGATLMGAGRDVYKSKDNYENVISNKLGIKIFNTVIIDEVSKATPPELFIPISLGKKLILVGDHKQLPPMFSICANDDQTLEEWAEQVGIKKAELGIDKTIFERLWKRHEGNASDVRAMLKRQYRMHKRIQGLIEQFYQDAEGGLECGLNEDELKQLEINHSIFDNIAIWSGTKEASKEKREGTSYYNDEEIDKVEKLLGKLTKLEDKGLSVGVITFYGAQLRKLKQRCGKYEQSFGKGKLVFGTVDRFQGRECDVVICSLVRNNKNGNIGFAKSINRINVAFSRARMALVILGNRGQFVYDLEDGEPKVAYKNIYDNCYKLTPKELEA